jgi:arginine decarboxylase
MSRESWSREIARIIYGLENSVRGNVLDIDEEGFLVIRIKDNVLRVKDLMEKNKLDVAYIRILPLIERAMETVYEAFKTVIELTGYKGTLNPVYPMKVNPIPLIVECIFKYGEKYKWGFNTGSLSELLLLLNLAEKYTPRTLIYDGVLTEKVIEALLKLHRLGWRIIVDIESEHDIEAIEKYPELEIGIRVKPIIKPQGKWSTATGLSGKFGLTINTLIKLREDFKWITERATLLHMHPGSQISRFSDVKKYLREVKEVFSELLELGFENISMVDPGGGVAYPYIDLRDGDEESPDYSIVDYAKTLVSEFLGLSKHPDIVFEGGRYIVSSHRLVVASVIDVRPYSAIHNKENLNVLQEYVEKIKSISDAKELISRIRGILGSIKSKSSEETSVRQRELYEDLVAFIENDIAQKISALLVEGKIDVREVLEDQLLLKILTSPSRRYILNMSIFADIPDAVLVDQYFQVIPVQGLNKPPDVLASLADLTCDSMGEISHYISPGNLLNTNSIILTNVDLRLLAIPGVKLKLRGVPLPLPLKGETHYIVVLDTGAYQDTLAMRHNLIYGAPEVIIDTSGDSVSIKIIRNGESRT